MEKCKCYLLEALCDAGWVLGKQTLRSAFRAFLSAFGVNLWKERERNRIIQRETPS